MDIVNDVVPVSELKKDLPKILKKIHSKKSPILITQNGRSAGILMDVKEFQNERRRLKVLEGILKAEKDIQEGNIYSHKEIEKRFNL